MENLKIALESEAVANQLERLFIEHGILLFNHEELRTTLCLESRQREWKS